MRTMYWATCRGRMVKRVKGLRAILHYCKMLKYHKVAKERAAKYKNIFEATISKIENTNFLCNDGSVYSTSITLYFNELSKPIPNSIGLIQHCIKI